MRVLLYISAIVLWALPIGAQAFTVELEIEPSIVRVGEPATATFIIRGASQPTTPEVPKIEGLSIQGPTYQQTVSIVNLQMERTASYSFRIMPLSTGEYSFGPFIYKADGKEVRVAEKKLKVVASGGTGSGTEGETLDWSQLLFATLTCGRQEVYNQEYFDIILSIYHRKVNIGGNLSLLNLPDSGLSMQPFQEMGTARETMGDEVYEVRRFKAKVKAITEGEFELSPSLRVNIIVPNRSRRPRSRIFGDSFFDSVINSHDSYPVEVKPSPLQIRVNPLPEQGRPDSYAGAVGKFGFNAEVSPNEVRTGDPITLRILVQGQGNIESVSAPAIQLGDGFKSYDARMADREMNESSTAGRKLFEQVIIPKSPQTTEIPAITFSYFDPQAAAYREIIRGPFPIKVIGTPHSSAQLVHNNGNASPSELKVLGSDIAYLKPSTTHWHHVDDSPFMGSRSYFAVQSLPLLALAGVVLYTRRRNALATDVARARLLKAPRETREALGSAQKALNEGDTSLFYESVWSAIIAYFGNRLNLSEGELVFEVIRESMANAGAEPKTIDKLWLIFTRCEASRFGDSGGKQPREELQKVYDDLTETLQSCNRIWR